MKNKSKRLRLPFTPSSVEHVKQVCCEEMGIDYKLIHTNTRKREIARTRQIAAYFLKKFIPGITLQSIADSFKCGHHYSTVLHSIRIVNDLCIYPEFKAKIQLISARLNCPQEVNMVSFEHELRSLIKVLKRNEKIINNLKATASYKAVRLMKNSKKRMQRIVESTTNKLNQS